MFKILQCHPTVKGLDKFPFFFLLDVKIRWHIVDV
jgi:hypothetical protein